MTSDKISRVAETLAEAWRARRQLESLPPDARPADRAEAYRIQDELARLLGLEVAGWKFGATAPASMRSMKVDQPVPGRIFRDRLRVSPATEQGELYRTPMIEPEFAVRVERDFPPQPARYTREDIASGCSLFLAIEIADYRVSQPSPPEVLGMIADNGGGAGWVLGPEVRDWQKVDFRTTPVSLLIDGRTAAVGLEGDGRIDPVDVAVWAANHLSERGIGLKAGEYLSTGSATAPTALSRGTECIAQFGPLGEVRVRFTR